MILLPVSTIKLALHFALMVADVGTAGFDHAARRIADWLEWRDVVHFVELAPACRRDNPALEPLFNVAEPITNSAFADLSFGWVIANRLHPIPGAVGDTEEVRHLCVFNDAKLV
jgi:hypothetical protein